MPNEIQNLLEKAWALRFNQQFEECLTVFSQLKTKLPFSAESEIAPTNPQKEFYISTICLRAALERWQDGLTRSQSRLDEISSRLLASSEMLPAVLLIQLGLNEVSRGNSQKALELFLDAIPRASWSFESLAAEINACECLDSLGLPNERSMARVEELIRQNEGKYDVTEFRATLLQLTLRKAFREGNFNKLCAIRPARLETQADYLSLWAIQLPVHAFSAEVGALEPIPFKSGFYNRQYRLRTLNHTRHPEDSSHTRPSEWIDRLYLWTWRWLTHPDQFSLGDILQELIAFPLADVAERLTMEDRLMLRNIIHWLSLFDAATFPLVRQKLDILALKGRPGKSLFAFFEFEYLVIEYFRAQAERDEPKARSLHDLIKQEPLYQECSCYLRALVGNAEGIPASHPILGLRNRYEVLYKEASSPSAVVVADLTSFEVVFLPKNRRLTSEPVTRSLELLRAKSCVRMDELAFVAYGLTHYDPFIHQAKIYNLLTRIKFITDGVLHIRSKDGKIYAEGNWREIQFTGGNHVTRNLTQYVEWKRFLAPARPLVSTRSATPPDADDPGARWKHLKPVMTRRELEQVTQKPRATLLRTLADWEKRRWIRRQGNARATRYILRPELMKRLRSEETIW